MGLDREYLSDFPDCAANPLFLQGDRGGLKRNDVAPIIALYRDIKVLAWGSGRADHWDDRQCGYVV